MGRRGRETTTSVPISFGFPLRGGPRWNRALADDELLFPAAARHFEGAIGFAVKEEEMPWLYHLLRRVLADAGLSAEAAKHRYARTRPFVVNGEPMGMPEQEEGYCKDGSYPSGHTAAGWAWALVLTELVPDRADAILRRGREFGEGRMVLNVHWQSDVDAGRLMGAATVARLHANAEFRHAMEMAKLEVAGVAGPG